MTENQVLDPELFEVDFDPPVFFYIYVHLDLRFSRNADFKVDLDPLFFFFMFI
jgi:hypothetical protein